MVWYHWEPEKEYRPEPVRRLVRPQLLDEFTPRRVRKVLPRVEEPPPVEEPFHQQLRRPDVVRHVREVEERQPEEHLCHLFPLDELGPFHPPRDQPVVVLEELVPERERPPREKV